MPRDDSSFSPPSSAASWRQRAARLRQVALQFPEYDELRWQTLATAREMDEVADRIEAREP